MTDLATGVLALLPVCGQAVEDIVVVARLDCYLPMNGHVVIDCGLLTAVDLVVLALARCPGVSGCGLMTAAGLAVTGLGGSVRVPMFVEEASGHAIPLAVTRAVTSVL